MRCSNPGCRRPTSGPQVRNDKALSIGVAAHITAASPGGPRFNAALTIDQRISITNGVWLCQNCAKLVDNDELRYSAETLSLWKQDAECHALDAITTIRFPSGASGTEPNLQPYLRAIIDEFRELPGLPNGTRNLSLSEIVPVRVRFPTKPREPSATKEPSSRVLRLEDTVGEERVWLLVGEGGQGKSTALRFLASYTAHQAQQQLSLRSGNTATPLIPVCVVLARRGHLLVTQIRQALLCRSPSCEATAIDDCLQRNPFLFLIDRLDETDALTACDDIEDLLKLYPLCRVVVASRPLGLLSRWPYPQGRIEPLRDAEIRTFLRRLLGDQQGERLFHALVHNTLLDLFRRPLFARLLALSSSDLSERRRFTIGAVLHDVIEKRFIGSWETRSEAGEKEKLVRDLLGWLGYRMVSRGSQSVRWERVLSRGVKLAKKRGMQVDVLFIEDVVHGIIQQGLLQQADGEIHFWHTNFRDYFAAVWLERRGSRWANYVRSWMPRWHESLLIHLGMLPEGRAQAATNAQLFGARATIGIISFGSSANILWQISIIPALVCPIPAVACRLFFLLRMLAQSDIACEGLKRMFVELLPREWGCMYLKGAPVPRIYASSRPEGDEYYYFSDLVGQMRIPESYAYLRSVDTHFSNVAPGLLYDPSRDMVEHCINYLLAETSENGGWANPRPNRADDRVVCYLILGSYDLRFSDELQKRLTSGDVQMRLKLLDTLSRTLDWYRGEDTAGVSATLEQRWTSFLVELALKNESQDVRSGAARMLRAIIDGHRVPSVARDLLLSKLEEPEGELRSRAIQALNVYSLSGYDELFWRLLGDADKSVAFHAICYFWASRCKVRFVCAVLRVLRNEAKPLTPLRTLAAAMAALAPNVNEGCKSRRRCIGLLTAAATTSAYIALRMHAMEALVDLEAKQSTPFLLDVFRTCDRSEAFAQVRFQAFRGVVMITAPADCDVILEGLDDSNESIRGLAAHFCSTQLGAGYRPVVGPKLFKLLEDSSSHVRDYASLALEDFGYLAKNWCLGDGPPKYLGPPQPSGRLLGAALG